MARISSTPRAYQGPDGLATSEGVGLLHSRLLSELGVPHAFSTRRGGVSRGVFGTLNFGNPGDLDPAERDPAESIERNWELLRRAMSDCYPDGDFEPRRALSVHQVHGADVHTVLTGSHANSESVRADAIVTDDPGSLATVRTADCAPVLIAASDGSLVAAVHAGWRGVVAGVVGQAIEEMCRLGADPAAMTAAIGPCIGPDALEVGPEVARGFHRVFGDRTPHIRPAPGPGKSLVHLQGALREQLLSESLAPEKIDTLSYCTVQHAADFFSHRRDQGRTGRMVAVIGPKRIPPRPGITPARP